MSSMMDHQWSDLKFQLACLVASKQLNNQQFPRVAEATYTTPYIVRKILTQGSSILHWELHNPINGEASNFKMELFNKINEGSGGC